MPPTAPMIGKRACLIFDNSPCKNSLFISKVTKKKKIAIRASLIQCRTESLIPKLFTPIKIYFSKVPKYKLDKSELLIINAITALNKRTKPLAASNLKNHLKGFVIFCIILFN